ncbi:uncharacterized protein EDB91DRAFT_1273197 [Suillus paluster]|uniref:uncharacterized protein n=1 Tax=Suillus paluster TaxID=48578 RepID=UPI001B882458|nr:uncharacterized protein EDB91DRAFT_1273197 [Suillus paluster]KAG1722789.1 hypothetical protein EDB91DRAFT_1273197 [Suillus paluster]
MTFLVHLTILFLHCGVCLRLTAESQLYNSTRTLWDIIWSCAATLFACTWTVIHPNIPGMNEGKVAITSRQLIITWAARQFFSTRAAAKDFNDYILGLVGQRRAATEHSTDAFAGWTVVHGFFAWTGGFMLYVANKPRATLTPDELLQFVRGGSVDMLVITEADIEDRSKSDILSKGITVLQLVWFVLQLVTRYVQNLSITLLEIDTLAVAALTCIAYRLWWKKPKDV